MVEIELHDFHVDIGEFFVIRGNESFYRVDMAIHVRHGDFQLPFHIFIGINDIVDFVARVAADYGVARRIGIDALETARRRRKYHQG